ncbi:hypothetical protein [Endozoicomonas lisbonensis]|uniref:Baseplate protein J-like domain-containing protein n=1 Tax=Endozoicomonas lisbonensis TaxID=3120522 RepID=A0ABV2SQX5_9GAMM
MKSSKRKLYNVYSSAIDEGVLTVKKLMPDLLKGRKTEKEKHITALSVIYQAMYHEAKDIRALLSAINAVQAFNEYCWIYSHDRNIVFPESADALDRLYQAKYSVKNGDFIPQDSMEFVLATPKGYCIDGYVMPSCLVSIGKFTQNYQTWSEVLDKSIGVKLDSDGLKPDHTMDVIVTDSLGNRKGITVYKPQTRSITITYSTTMTMQLTFELNDFIQAVSAKNVDEFFAIASSGGNFSLQQPQPGQKKSGVQTFGLTDQELEQQYRLFKLVAALIIYTAAEPSALKAGFPSRYAKSKGEPVIQGNYSPKTFGLVGKQQSSPKDHMRSFHYRQLTHERYYKGEYKDMTPGSRIVFVRESFVGKQVTPETLVLEES